MRPTLANPWAGIRGYADVLPQWDARVNEWVNYYRLRTGALVPLFPAGHAYGLFRLEERYGREDDRRPA